MPFSEHDENLILNRETINYPRRKNYIPCYNGIDRAYHQVVTYGMENDEFYIATNRDDAENHYTKMRMKYPDAIIQKDYVVEGWEDGNKVIKTYPS